MCEPEDDDILVACARDELKEAGLSEDEAEFNLEVMRNAGCFRALTPVDEHEGCRIRQFSLWSRVMLEHEREHISRALATAAGFMSECEYADLVHDVTDIDWVLSMNPELRVKVPDEGST